MAQEKRYEISVTPTVQYLPEQSDEKAGRYVFAYTINIRNEGAQAARLVARHWVISDANGKVQEVRGDGVVGEQPWLRPGDNFEYTSGAVLETSVGTMKGSYRMLADDGTWFEAPIAEFTLSIPRTIH